MGTSFPQMPNGFNPASSSFLPGGFSQFNKTGVPGLMGGSAYPPGSSMTSMMDDLNNQVASVTKGPNGENVVDWAKNLAAGQAQGSKMPSNQGVQSQQASRGNTGSLAANSPSGGQLTLLLLADALEQVVQKLKGGKGKNTQNQGDAETAFGGLNGFCAQA